MSDGSCQSTQPALCGCCEGIAQETPEPISNRPGLSAITYRVGTHNTFLASLLASLSSSIIPPWAPLGTNLTDPSLANFNPAVALAPLRTRDSSDFSIALLDCWATTLDILTFYQERIANEFYLRTAVDAASITDLAQLVGYQPSPGVAASCYLAFTLNNAPGSPDNVPIPAGTRVQSVPGPGQQPQVFETSSDITALIELNAIPPVATSPWALNPGITSIWIQGTSNNINVGDAILFVNEALYGLASADSTSSAPAADFHFVTAVSIDSAAGNTVIQWDQPLNWPVSGDNTASIYVFRKKAALFGSQAPDPRTFSATHTGMQSVPGWPGGSPASADWSWIYSGNSQVNLDASYPGLTPPQGGGPLWAVLAVSLPAAPSLAVVYSISAAADINPTQYTLSSRSTQLTLANGVAVSLSQLVDAWVEADLELAVFEELGLGGIGPFEQILATLQAPLQALGINASIGATIASVIAAAAAVQQPFTGPAADQLLTYIISQTRSATAFIQSNLLTPADPPLAAGSTYNGYACQAGLLMPVAGTTLELITTQQLAPSQPVAVSGNRLRLQVADSFSASSDADAGFAPGSSTGTLPIAPGQIFLIDAYPPAAVSGSTDVQWSVITTDGVAGLLTIANDNVVLAPSETSDPLAGETALLSGPPSPQGPIVSLTFQQALSRIYDLATVTVNANTVAATNGETMYQILGNGDATNPALSFQLQQSPLTWVSSPLNNGAVSTLQVWVNNLEWQQVNNFLDSGPADRVYTTETDSTGTVTVEFGDGQQGELTPTGQMNIRAVYRVGIGSAGNVNAGQLSQALDRPQGLKTVTNPDPATGGADPDTASDARASAPLNVLTLGRVVSLEDYQNYALAYAGIAKALATWTWVNRRRSVFLTLAGDNGEAYESTDQTIGNLLTSFQDAGNPYVPVYIPSPSYSAIQFDVGANIQVESDYDPTQVQAQVWQALSTAFSFDQRQIGQGVAQSEVVAVIQQVPGVIAVELTTFNVHGTPPVSPLPPVLLASSPDAGTQGEPTGAQLLTLDPASQGNLAVTS
jgi:hypothetical protein